MDNNSVDIPIGVVNVKEYHKMLALQKHPAIKNTMYLSSEGDEINLAMLSHRLKNFIKHLSPKEQEEVVELKRQYNVIRAKISTAKSMAYGTAGRYGGRTKEDAKINKLTPYEEDIIELLGRMFTVVEVVRIMGEDYSIDTDEDDVKLILKKHVIEIERKRDEFRNKMTDVRLYNKRPRLEELAWMYNKMKIRYVSHSNIEAYNAMLRTLEQLRKESEGDILTINGALDINIEVTIQNHIQKEILKTINLKEIILGRVAARMGFDTKKLVAGLHNSYYAKFVDISGEFDEEAEMSYPSNQAYDFTAIEKTAGREVIDISAEDVTEAEKSSAERTRELFLAKIRSQKKEMDIRSASFDAEAETKRPIAKDIDEKELVRGAGRGKDKLIPSKTRKGKKKESKVDYKTGEKKPKTKK